MESSVKERFVCYAACFSPQQQYWRQYRNRNDLNGFHRRFNIQNNTPIPAPIPNISLPPPLVISNQKVLRLFKYQNIRKAAAPVVFTLQHCQAVSNTWHLCSLTYSTGLCQSSLLRHVLNNSSAFLYSLKTDTIDSKTISDSSLSHL